MSATLVFCAAEVTGGAVVRVLEEAGISPTVRPLEGLVSVSACLVETGAQVLVFDLWHSDEATLRTIRAVRRQLPAFPVIVVSVDSDREICRLRREISIRHWISRVELLLLPVMVRRALEYHRLSSSYVRRRESVLASSGARRIDLSPLVTRSPAMETALAVGELQLQWGEPLVLCGEAGSGRSTLARAIHARTPRPGHFVQLDCRGLTAAQYERVLAECRVRACEGTLFFRAADELPEELFRELASRHAEEWQGEKITLILSARPLSGRDPPAPALAPWRVDIPPLRGRPEDIPLLARYFLLEAGLSRENTSRVLTEKTLAALVHYPFPGNAGELRAMMRRRALGVLRGTPLPEDTHLMRMLRRAVSVRAIGT